MKRTKLLKFLPIAGVALLAPTISFVSCNKDQSNTWIEKTINKTMSNIIDPFWVGLNVKWGTEPLVNYVEWSFIFGKESDKETWDFSLIVDGGSRTGPSHLPEFHLKLINNKSDLTKEHSICNFQIKFKYYENGIASQQLTWKETSQMIQWTWENSDEKNR